MELLYGLAADAAEVGAGVEHDLREADIVVVYLLHCHERIALGR